MSCCRDISNDVIRWRQPPNEVRSKPCWRRRIHSCWRICWDGSSPRTGSRPMSSRTSPPLVLELDSLRTQRCCVRGTLAACLLAPFMLAGWLGWVAVVVLGIMTTGLTAIAFRHAGWLGGRRSLTRAVWRTDGSWCLSDGAGQQIDATLADDSRMSPRAIWLRWKPDFADAPRASLPRRPAVVLLPSDLPPGDFRRLLVRLRVDGSECAPVVFENPSQIPRS